MNGLPPQHPEPGDPDFGCGPRYHRISTDGFVGFAEKYLHDRGDVGPGLSAANVAFGPFGEVGRVDDSGLNVEWLEGGRPAIFDIVERNVVGGEEVLTFEVFARQANAIARRFGSRYLPFPGAEPACDFCRREVPCECDAANGGKCMCSCGRCLAPASYGEEGEWPEWVRAAENGMGC